MDPEFDRNSHEFRYHPCPPEILRSHTHDISSLPAECVELQSMLPASSFVAPGRIEFREPVMNLIRGRINLQCALAEFSGLIEPIRFTKHMREPAEVFVVPGVHRDKRLTI